MYEMDAIILAGGLGTRLSALNLGLPKALVPINGKPFLEILLQFLNQSHAINNVIIATGFRSEQIVTRYKDNWDYNFEIRFSLEQELLGTGGAIKKALALTRRNEILALNGDSYTDVSLEKLLRFHRARKAAMTMVLAQSEDAARYGLVRLDSDQRITSFEEKTNQPSKGLINAGMYLFNRELFDEIEPDKVLSMEKEILPGFVTKQIFGYVSQGKFIDIGIPEAYYRAGDYLNGVF